MEAPEQDQLPVTASASFRKDHSTKEIESIAENSNGSGNSGSSGSSVDAEDTQEARTTTISKQEKDDEVDEREEDEDDSNAMKLIVRSPYWGRILKGKTRRDPHNPDRPYRTITCQAVLSNEGQYWGCCPNHGKRVLELKEYHFSDHHPDDWDLYMVGSSVSTANIVHTFFLLPQNQTAVDVNRHMYCGGWSFIGTVSASMMRMDLGGLLQDILKQNDNYTFRFHHVHIEILIDQVLDRETAHVRKTRNDQARVERAKRRAEKEKFEKSVAGAPPIPHVVSNDASWATETTLSTSTSTIATASLMHESWNESFHYQGPNSNNNSNIINGNPTPPWCVRPKNGGEQAPSHWYPGSAALTNPLPPLPPANPSPTRQAHPHPSPPMVMPPHHPHQHPPQPQPSPAQQVLQGYPMPMTMASPPGFAHGYVPYPSPMHDSVGGEWPMPHYPPPPFLSEPVPFPPHMANPYP